MQKKKISRFLSLFLTMALVFSLMPTASAADVSVSQIKISHETLTMAVNDTFNLNYTISPNDATNKEVTWESSNKTVADVTSAGQVTAKKAGTATITVKSKDGKYSSGCKVTVRSIKLDETLTLQNHESKTLSATISPGDIASSSKLIWESKDPSIAKVVGTGTKGTITAEGIGTTEIKVSFEDGSSPVICTVTVKVPTPSLSPKKLSLTVNQSKNLEVKDLPEGTSITSWNVDKDEIVGLSNISNSGCTVTGHKAGTAKVTATYSDGKTMECDISVSTTATPSISKTSVTVAKNKTATLTISNVPTGGHVEWSSDDSNKATISGSGTGQYTGTVTGKASSGKTTIRAKVKDSSDAFVKDLSCTVTLGTTSSSPRTISYTTSKNEAISFNSNDFKNVCKDYTGESLDYVKFTQPSSSKGTLYYDYNTSTENYNHKVANKSYYPSSSSSTYINEVYFVPHNNYTNTVSISYTAYYDGGKFDGTISVKINGTSSGDVTYNISKGSKLEFSNAAFNDYCDDKTNNDFEYIKFDTDSLSTSKGRLYYQYDTSSQKEAGTYKYYRTGSTNRLLKDLTFVPKSDYDGTVKIGFDGVSDNNKDFSGTLVINVGSSGELTYSIEKNGKLNFSKRDFNNQCNDRTGDDFDYVTFSSVSSSEGTLYYKHGTSDQSTAGSKKYYYSKSPLLSDLTFVPSSKHTGPVKIKFDCVSEDGEKYSSTVVINVGGGTTVKGDVTYTSPANTPVSLSVPEFNEYSKKETNKTYNLHYVTFGTVDASQGTLYYKYGESGQKVAGNTKYYNTGESTLLKDLTFVPQKDFTDLVQIKFSGANTNGDPFEGTLGILFEPLNDPTKIAYSTEAKAISFVNSDFVSACAKRGGGALKSVKFALPDETVGTLYYNYVSPTSYGGKVNSSTAYTNGTGTGTIGSVSFLPKAGYNGVANITYTGTDSGGNTFTGYIYITVTAKTNSSTFNDMKNHAWAAASVDFLNDYKVVTGTTKNTYDPGGSITRGDFILMLYRAFGFTSTSTSNFKDVPADSYYAQAIAAAKALGIAQGTNNRFEPQASLTREDAMVLIQRTMEKTNRTLPSGSTATLDRFADNGKISSYAKSAVASLVQASIVKGDENGNFNPKNTISRAEMAVALHRVLTL